jgi:hypothetical protein
MKYWDFWSISFHIKGILLFIKATAAGRYLKGICCTVSLWDKGYWICCIVLCTVVLEEMGF